MLQKELIKAVFIDWDHTLWDFEANAATTLEELYKYHNFDLLTTLKPRDFVAFYKKYNYEMWALYEKQLINKETLRTQRFNLAMDAMGIPKELQPKNLWNDFLMICPQKKQLIPHAETLLQHISKNYPVVIITNGFRETQKIKILNSGLEKYFADIVISDEVGLKKPMREIFELSAKKVNVRTCEGLMIGDSFVADVEGALNAEMQAIHFVGEAFEGAKHANTVETLLEIKNLL